MFDAQLNISPYQDVRHCTFDELKKKLGGIKDDQYTSISVFRPPLGLSSADKEAFFENAKIHPISVNLWTNLIAAAFTPAEYESEIFQRVLLHNLKCIQIVG